MARSVPNPTSKAVAFLLLTTSVKVSAAVFCVNSASQLVDAFQAAEINLEDNEVRIRTGLYDAPPGGWHIDLTSEKSLDVSGGWLNATCTAALDSGLSTLLDGGNSVRPLTIDTTWPNVDANHHIAVRNLTFQHGNDADVGALKISDPGPIYGGIILVEGNVFLANATQVGTFYGAPALMVATDGPDFAGGIGLTIRNNLFAGNTGPNVAAAFAFSNNAIEVVNNTFANNLSSEAALASRVVFDYFTGTSVTFTNNIFWRNVPPGSSGSYDLVLTAQAALVSNDVEWMGGIPGSNVGSISLDPLFSDASNANYRPLPNSPMIDAGVDLPSGGVSISDLDAHQRIQQAHIDLGAFEFNTFWPDEIFADAFEIAP